MRRKKLWVLAVLLVMMIIWIACGNSALTVQEIQIESDRIPKGFSGFRIAQVSDLHNVEFGKENQKLIDLLKSIAPDMIVLTGDLVDSYRTDIAVSLRFAEQAVSIAPTYYVTGNHESRIAEYEALLAGLMDVGVIPLLNDSVKLERGTEWIALLGVQDPAFTADYLTGDSASVMAQNLAKISDYEEVYSILLSHRPELFDFYVQSGMDLVFSGHAHGGQFRLPFIGGLFAPGQGFFPEYDAGLYTVDGTNMIVSRGLGNSLFPFRINNRPEIVVAELISVA